MESKSFGLVTAFVLVLATLPEISALNAADAELAIVPDCRTAGVAYRARKSCERAAGSEAAFQQAVEALLPHLPENERDNFATGLAAWIADIEGLCAYDKRPAGMPFPTTEQDFQCIADRMEYESELVRTIAPSRKPLVPDCVGTQVKDPLWESCTRAATSEANLQQALDSVLPRLPADIRGALALGQAGWFRGLDEKCEWELGGNRRSVEAFPTTERDFTCIADNMTTRTRFVQMIDLTREAMVPDCQKVELAEASKDTCMRAANTEATLQQALNSVMPILPTGERVALAMDQAEWLVELDNGCLWHEARTRDSDEPFLTTEGDFICVTDYMAKRARVVKAMDPTRRPKSLEGEYTTWMGSGSLLISEQVGDKVAYDLSIGGGNATGGMEGFFTLSADGRSSFDGDDATPPADEVDPSCDIRFHITPLVINTVEYSCDDSHGVGMSFTQTFYRMAAEPERSE